MNMYSYVGFIIAVEKKFVNMFKLLFYTFFALNIRKSLTNSTKKYIIPIYN